MEIPEGVEVEISGQRVTVSGPKGTVNMEFKVKGLKIKKNDSRILVEVDGKGKLPMVNTTYGYIKNMIKGVTEGFEKRLKVVYAHFPISVEVKGKEVLIKNFLGEKMPRRAKIIGSTKVEVKKDIIVVSGADKYEVGQTAANIMASTQKKGRRDSRIFQDGIYPMEE